MVKLGPNLFFWISRAQTTDTVLFINLQNKRKRYKPRRGYHHSWHIGKKHVKRLEVKKKRFHILLLWSNVATKTSYVAKFNTLKNTWKSFLNNIKNKVSLAFFRSFSLENIIYTFTEPFNGIPALKNAKGRVAKASKCKIEKTLTYSLKQWSFSVTWCNLEVCSEYLFLCPTNSEHSWELFQNLEIIFLRTGKSLSTTSIFG